MGRPRELLDMAAGRRFCARGRKSLLTGRARRTCLCPKDAQVGRNTPVLYAVWNVPEGFCAVSDFDPTPLTRHAGGGCQAAAGGRRKAVWPERRRGFQTAIQDEWALVGRGGGANYFPDYKYTAILVVACNLRLLALRQPLAAITPIPPRTILSAMREAVPSRRRLQATDPSIVF